MNPSEQRAQEGPYKVKSLSLQSHFVMNGEEEIEWRGREDAAQSFCNQLNAAYRAGQQDSWISVSVRLPEPGVPVIAFVMNPANPKWSRRIRAVYAEERTLELGEGDPWDGCTCDEENGDWYCQPGWYEQNWYEETNWRVTDTVTHWMELPATPISK